MEIPKPGNGYRLLRVGEVVSVKDQVWCCDGTDFEWDNVSHTLFGKIAAGTIIRRRVVPVPDFQLLKLDKGFRALEPGNDLLEGDEVWYQGKWVDALSVEAGFQSTYRRSIEIPDTKPKVEETHTPSDPNNEYRLLKRGEIIEPGDEQACGEFQHWDGYWSPVPSKYYGKPFLADPLVVVRRKIAKDIRAWYVTTDMTGHLINKFSEAMNSAEDLSRASNRKYYIYECRLAATCESEHYVPPIKRTIL